MSIKYYINYEALMYNFPECGNFEFLGHKFVSNLVTPEIEKCIIPNDEVLLANFGLQCCCLPYSDGNLYYTTAKNIAPIELVSDVTTSEDLSKEAEKLVKSKVTALEEHLILTTNVHIFVPIVKITVTRESDSKTFLYGLMNNRPMPYKKWCWLEEGIDLFCRLHFHLDKNAFDKFRFHKSHTRYQKAFDYYIRSFHEFDHASAFCLLCSSLDAITGSNEAKETKKRLSKYSSILFCKPKEIEDLKSKMEHFYKIRSTFTHGKRNDITVRDEIELREYVRKFLIVYFLFWQEMNIKNEPQMLQKLDDIDKDHGLYIKYAPASYGFVALSDEHEKQPSGIVHLSMEEKKKILISKMAETIDIPSDVLKKFPSLKNEE